MRYRNVILVAFSLDRPSVSDAGTVYFPSDEFPFTRVYEPRNRSSKMAPAGKTSLVAETPCDSGENMWKADDTEVIATTRRGLERVGWLNTGEDCEAVVRRLPYAYPVLETGYSQKIESLRTRLSQFENLRFSGRSGRFVYSWLHEMLRFGKDIVAETAHSEH